MMKNIVHGRCWAASLGQPRSAMLGNKAGAAASMSCGVMLFGEAVRVVSVQSGYDTSDLVFSCFRW